MAKDGRKQRRPLLDVLDFATAKENGITNIESRKSIVGGINFAIEVPIRRAIGRAMERNGEEYVELTSGDYFIYDLTEKVSPRLCRIGLCQSRAKILETRLIFAYDEKDQEYQMAEFSPEVRNILLATRKRAAICEDHMLEAQIKGETLDIYERIPQIGELARITRIKGKPPVETNVLRPVFATNKKPANETRKVAEVIDLFDREKK